MFRQLAHLTKLLADAPRINREMQELRARLVDLRFDSDAGDGQVRATVDGRGHVLSMRFAPTLIQAGNAELIGELVRTAVNAARQQARENRQREKKQISSGLDLNELGSLLAGAPRATRR